MRPASPQSPNAEVSDRTPRGELEAVSPLVQRCLGKDLILRADWQLELSFSAGRNALGTCGKAFRSTERPKNLPRVLERALL
jgi:hypothetical protein